MAERTTWSTVEHGQAELSLVLSVADALDLRALLPRLQELVADTRSRNPETRAERRSSGTILQMLLDQLDAALIPYGVPDTLDPGNADPPAPNVPVPPTAAQHS